MVNISSKKSSLTNGANLNLLYKTFTFNIACCNAVMNLELVPKFCFARSEFEINDGSVKLGENNIFDLACHTISIILIHYISDTWELKVH